MDKLDSAITNERLEIERLRQEIVTKQVRLEALLEAASLRPATERVSQLPSTNVDHAISVREASTKRTTGRTPGSINGAWRKFLAFLVEAGNMPTARGDVVRTATEHSGLAEASARQRIRQLIEAGHLTEKDNAVWVSDAAIERFRLRRHKNNEAPPALAGPQNGSGAQTPGFGG